MTIASHTITSMTGFARASGSHDGQAYAWELKSVNGKALDLRLRLPTGFDHLEIQARQALAQVLKRGNVQVNLSLTETGGATKLTINRDVLQTYVALAKDLQKQVGGPDVSVEALLSMKGVVEMVATTTDETVLAAHDKAILKSLDEAIVALAAARLAEGAKLSAIIAAQLDQIAELHKRATANPSRKAGAIKARLREQVVSLLEAGMMDEQRLAQEAAILATKADIQEELDRLGAHISAAKLLLTSKEPVGRKFDFLAQEFNREANTLCSKANDAGLTQIGLDLKTVIDQMREQVQNIE